MDETRTREFPNLLNVALSRARRQLFVIAHAAHVAEHYPGRLLERLLRMVRDRHEVCTVPEDLRMQPLLAGVARRDHPAAA
jgi:hypothetical protein